MVYCVKDHFSHTFLVMDLDVDLKIKNDLTCNPSPSGEFQKVWTSSGEDISG